MRIVINPQIHRKQPAARKRKMRRLIYLALIAQDMGHEVVLHTSPEFKTAPMADHGYGRFLSDLEWCAGRPPSCDVYMASCGPIRHGLRTPPGAKVVAWKETIAYRDDHVTAHRADLIVAYAWRLADFSQPHPYAQPTQTRIASPHEAEVAPKILSVPWLPHEDVLEQLDQDGLTWHYLRDELSEIRAAYPASGDGKIGFCGFRWPWRSTIAERFAADDRFEIIWTDVAERKMTPADYLRWVAGCKATLQLEGDTWKCSRHCESVMMGTPVVQLRHTIDLTPPMTPHDTILIDDWSDADAIDGMVAAEPSIRATFADDAYREGWSLRGQFKQALKRLGY